MVFHFSCNTPDSGVEGFEPPNDGIKTRCLTAWPHPKNTIKYIKSGQILLASSIYTYKVIMDKSNTKSFIDY